MLGGEKNTPTSNFKHPNLFAYSVALGVSFAVALCIVLGWLPRMENASKKENTYKKTSTQKAAACPEAKRRVSN